MGWLLACWAGAVAAGLLGPRWLTGALTLVTGIVFIWLEAGMLGRPSGWLQLGVLAMTPWLLAAARTRFEQSVERLKADEAARRAELAEAARTLMSLEQSTREMEAQITQTVEVYRVTKEASRTLHLEELFAASLELMPGLLKARGVALIDLSKDPPQVLRAAPDAEGRLRPLQAAPASAGAPSNLERGVITKLEDATESSKTRVERVPGTQVVWAPLWREQKPAGAILAEGLPEAHAPMLAIVANQLSLQLSRIHLYQQVEALAVTDALTGLYVRGYFTDRATEELARSKRHGLACTVLMADLDLFKQKNDTYGHLVGDVVLKDVAGLLQRNLREVDVIARYGGEEFILMLVETTAEQAMPIAQRLRQLVEVHPIRAYDELLAQTISIGLAEFPRHAATLDALIDRADQALYAAKRAGRNRVVAWSPALEKSALA